MISGNVLVVLPAGGFGIYVEWISGWCYARECHEGDWLFPTGRKQPKPDHGQEAL